MKPKASRLPTHSAPSPSWLGQVLHEAVLRAMLPGLEGLEGVGPEKAKQLMQARVNQSCSQFWPVKRN